MRAEGKIIKRDYMTPEDREWLEKDIEDSVRLAGDNYEIPFYENDEWIRQFGSKPWVICCILYYLIFVCVNVKCWTTQVV